MAKQAGYHSVFALLGWAAGGNVDDLKAKAGRLGIRLRELHIALPNDPAYMPRMVTQNNQKWAWYKRSEDVKALAGAFA
jgi:predicted trehalose synthase